MKMNRNFNADLAQQGNFLTFFSLSFFPSLHPSALAPYAIQSDNAIVRRQAYMFITFPKGTNKNRKKE
jgi:hypothetical protein